MQIRLIGRQILDFQSGTGSVKGTNLFGAYKDENVEGLRCDRFFVKDGIEIPECKINDTLNLSFNMRGKVESVSKA
ncbi:MAG: hypothetical protein IKY94_01605 [Lachnospiraceae bacterium]|nr:hypothetical protein [Lachnospiraceae bacterium]